MLKYEHSKAMVLVSKDFAEVSSHELWSPHEWNLFSYEGNPMEL